MTPCPLCAQPDHPGRPCYADLRIEWKRLEAEKMLRELPEWGDLYLEFYAQFERNLIQEGYESR
jgi:hypothetical protein